MEPAGPGRAGLRSGSPREDACPSPPSPARATARRSRRPGPHACAAAHPRPSGPGASRVRTRNGQLRSQWPTSPTPRAHQSRAPRKRTPPCDASRARAHRRASPSGPIVSNRRPARVRIRRPRSPPRSPSTPWPRACASGGPGASRSTSCPDPHTRRHRSDPSPGATREPRPSRAPASAVTRGPAGHSRTPHVRARAIVIGGHRGEHAQASRTHPRVAGPRPGRRGRGQAGTQAPARPARARSRARAPSDPAPRVAALVGRSSTRACPVPSRTHARARPRGWAGGARGGCGAGVLVRVAPVRRP